MLKSRFFFLSIKENLSKGLKSNCTAFDRNLHAIYPFSFAHHPCWTLTFCFLVWPWHLSYISITDGSETTEDQQLLDRDCGTGEYPPVMDSSAQLGYGTFYDHMGGYYYEYPVMLVGPAPMQSQVAPSVLAAVPCAPVPLRPIEWINPTYVPKLPDQPYCIMNYEVRSMFISIG